MPTELRAPVIRRLDISDAEAVLAISVACDMEEMGEKDADLSDILRDMAVSGAEWYGVDEAAGGLTAYGWAVHVPPHTLPEVDVRMRPGSDPGAGLSLLDVTRAAAARISPGRPVHAWAHIDDAPRQGWYVAAGGTPVRHFWRMVVDFDDASPVSPEPTADVTIEVVGDNDDMQRQVFDVIDAAFQDHFGHDEGATTDYAEFVRRTHSVDGYDPTLWWLARVDGAPAAALLGRALPESGLVNMLGTLREFRGRGLGRALLQTAFVAMHARGFGRATLGVDAANPTGAVHLYESVGMRTDNTWIVYELPALPVTS